MKCSRILVKGLKLSSKRYLTAHTEQNTVVVEQFGKVRTIGINRPGKRNCLNAATIASLEKAIQDYENDEDSLAAVLYGIGGNFCSGYDLEEIATDTGANNLLDRALKCTMRHIKKPLVAGISGYAAASGFELALMCDLRVMEETAQFAMLNRRYGIPIVDGGITRLQQMVGLSRTLDLVLTGRTLSAKEAFEWGIANRLVACGTALGQALNVASSLIKFPQTCLLSDRRSVYNAAAFEKLLRTERELCGEGLTAESVDGARKFLSGIGRHGKSYDLKEKPQKHWEIE